MGERRIVTVVFADVVDSTALLVRLGERRGEEVRSALSAAHRTATIAANGTVVKDLGDGIMAVFGSVSDAIEGAVGLQRSTADVARRLRLPELAIRVGVALGEATSDEPTDGGPITGTDARSSRRPDSAGWHRRGKSSPPTMRCYSPPASTAHRSARARSRHRPSSGRWRAPPVVRDPQRAPEATLALLLIYQVLADLVDALLP